MGNIPCGGIHHPPSEAVDRKACSAGSLNLSRPRFRCICGERHILGDGHVCRPVRATLDIVPTAVRMPELGQYVLMWEVRHTRWAVGSWCPRFQQWSNRDDPEYAIHPENVSHWMPLPNAKEVTTQPSA